MPNIRTAAAIAALVAPAAARADAWLVAEAPAAIAVSDAQEGVFRPGLMPAIGAYVENQRFALGARLRAGVLRDGPAPAGNREDPGLGGLTTAGLALRLGLADGWIELVAGGGITGRDLVPAVEAGIGWTFTMKSVDVGPSLRYARVVSRDAMAAFGTAELALVGVDLRFGKDRPRPRRLVSAVLRAEVVAAAEPPPAARDADHVVDVDTGCASELDGCPLADEIVIKDDRIVLDERVLFDFDRARVRSRGRRLLGELARIWRQHPEWRHITVEGHADARGTDAYNQWLSEERAARVRAVLLGLGFAADAVSAVGYGRTRVRDAAETEDAHQSNRRVEFVIDRRGEQP